MKPSKNELKRDKVSSDTIHIGIELELIAPCSDGSGHDDDACAESRADQHRDYINGMSVREIVEYQCGVILSRDDARSLESYLDLDTMRDEAIENWEDYEGCRGDCGYETNNGSHARDEIQSDLKRLTGNNSFKVVSDGSINHDSDETDAEVCWNYFISKDTLKDNETILKHLKSIDCRFNTSCGLHINLNNYLKVPAAKIETSALDFLFNFVAPSRRASNYCNNYGMNNSKYSMIFNQGDRLEFRFFSPTLEAEKLNHYVTLAHHIYKRLAGIDAKLPKKTMKYLLDKMSKAGIDELTAFNTLKKTNSIKSVMPIEESLPLFESNGVPF